MTREMATRGSEVALGVAERLGLDIVHHEVVEHYIARRTGLRDSEVHRFLEGEASMWERWRMDPSRLSRFTALEILELAAKGNVLIRGWGASYLLRAIPSIACVRICAPLAFREKVLMDRLAIHDELTARREIERNDAAHTATMQRMCGISWRYPEHYALVLNTARVPVQDCVEHIVQLVCSSAYQETERSRRELLDHLVKARVNEAFEQEFGSRSNHYGFEASVHDGHVILRGATTDSQLIVDALRLLQSIDGVRSVENKVSHVEFAPRQAI